MALIRCTECGKMVSDKATACPNCGCPVSNDEICFCTECGAQLHENAVECPNCGHPTNNVVDIQDEDEKSKKRKWLIVAFLVTLLCVIGGWRYYEYTNQSQTDIQENVFKEQKDSVEIIDVREDIVNLTPEFIETISNCLVGMFSEGYAAVCKDGKWGYINTKGEEVIPANIDAMGAGRFSEGLAFVLSESYGDFRVIDKKGNTIFKGECDFDCTIYDSEDMPYYIKGKLYVPTYENAFQYEVYDKQGNRIDAVSYEEGEKFIKQNQTGEYTLFKRNNGEYEAIGIKDPSGNVVLPAEYDIINGSIEGKTDFHNGVVLVVLREDDIDEYDNEDYGGVSWEGSRYYYGYADLKGNDTFTAEQKRRCRQSKMRAENTNDYDSGTASYDDYGSESNLSSTPQWVQGTWTHDVTAPMVGVVASYRVEISGNTLTFYRNGEFQYRDNITCQNGRIVGQHGNFVLKESVQRLADETGTYNKVGGGSNGSSGIRFSSDYDVIGYLSGRTFREISSGGVLQIRQDGVYVNGNCMTGAPRVSSFSSTSAVVRASLIPSGTIIFNIDAQNGTITDSSGLTYR